MAENREVDPHVHQNVTLPLPPPAVEAAAAPTYPVKDPMTVHPGMNRYAVSYPDIGIAYLGEIRWPRAKINRFHRHREFQMIFVLDGKMGFDFDSFKWEPATGVAYLIPPIVPHNAVQDPAAPVVHFIDFRVAPDAGTVLSKYLQAVPSPVQLKAPIARMRAAAAQMREAIPLDWARRTARLHAAIWELVSIFGTPAEKPADDPADASLLRLESAEKFLRDRLSEPLDVGAVAKAAGLSRSQLSRLFARHLGLGPAERLRQLRITKARELLAGSTLAIKEITHVCGFTCPNHFSRVFQEAAGVTPTAFRAAAGRESRVAQS